VLNIARVAVDINVYVGEGGVALAAGEPLDLFEVEIAGRGPIALHLVLPHRFIGLLHILVLSVVIEDKSPIQVLLVVLPHLDAPSELVLELFSVLLIEGRCHCTSLQIILLQHHLATFSELADEVEVRGLKLMVFYRIYSWRLIIGVSLWV